MAKKSRSQAEAQILEQGNIYFMYRPRVEHEEAAGADEVQRFYMVLKPHGKRRYRLMVIGRKHMPDLPRHERVWGFVDMVRDGPSEIEQELREHSYRTKTRGERTLPSARPAGEGSYAIVGLDGQMHLAYALELPDRPGDVQQDLRIVPEASFALSVKNPEKGQPAAAGLGPEDKPDYPKGKQAEFRGRRFEREDPALLDFEGAEFVLVGARDNPEEQYGLDLEPEREELRTADIVKDMRMARSRHPVEPLLRGEWR